MKGSFPDQDRSEAARQSLGELESRLGEAFLGQRQDRGEWTGWVRPDSWPEAARILRDHTSFCEFSDLTAVDYVDREPRFDVVLHVLSHVEHASLRLKTLVSGPPGPEPVLPTLTGVWPAANWYEREVYDLFGVVFDGHPDLQRILLPPDYQGHPLRKDYPVTGPVTSAYR